VPWGKPYPTKPAERRALKKLYDDFGLKILGLQGRSRGTPGSADPAHREQYLSDLKQQVDMLHEWGNEFIGVWGNGPQKGLTNQESCKWLADTWGRLTEYATGRGMYVVTEPEPVFVDNKLELLQFIVDEIGSPNFRLIFDPSHSSFLGGGDPFKFLKQFRGRIGHVHFCDSDATQRRDPHNWNVLHSTKHLTLGDGKLDLLGMLLELKNQGYDKWIMMDLYQIPDLYRAAIVGKQKMDEMLDTLFMA